MPTPTSYHEWIKPPEGGDDWAQDYYDFKDDLDTKVHQSGPLSERPSSAPTGAKYWATDEDALYRYDGSSWNPLGTFWQGYELVFDGQSPDEDRYIRFVTE